MLFWGGEVGQILILCRLWFIYLFVCFLFFFTHKCLADFFVKFMIEMHQLLCNLLGKRIHYGMCIAQMYKLPWQIRGWLTQIHILKFIKSCLGVVHRHNYAYWVSWWTDWEELPSKFDYEISETCEVELLLELEVENSYLFSSLLIFSLTWDETVAVAKQPRDSINYTVPLAYPVLVVYWWRKKKKWSNWSAVLDGQVP